MLSKNQILKARRAVEKLYTGSCTITERRKVRNETTKLMDCVDVIVLKEQPCRLIFKSAPAAGQGEAAADTVQTVKLLLAPDIKVQEGSKITVTQNAVIADYIRSGIPAVYATHQEIMLDAFERWA